MSQKVIARNKKALHEYFIHDRYECGIVLVGTEIKSIRLHKVNLIDAYVSITDNELFIKNMHIGLFQQGNRFNHEEKADRKLLMHRHQINKLKKEVQNKGFTIIPLSLYLVKGRAKLEIALAKGKHLYDKRQSEKEKDLQRQIVKRY